MKPVHTWADLTQFGINALTGEACAYSMRVLCDVNEAGAALLADYLGLLSEHTGDDPTAFRGAWNSTVDGKPAVGSIMLDRDSLQRLAQFAFFRAGAVAVFINYDGCVTPIPNAGRLAVYEASPLGVRVNRNPATNTNQPHVGSRNAHAFTGRVE